MKNDTLRQILVILAVIGTITINALANILPINGQGTGEISDRFQVYFVPAGYVFAIWGVVYLGWIAYAVYQALPAQRSNTRIASIAYPFVLNGIANSAWIFAWHYNQFGWSLAAMLVVLTTLILIYLRLGIGIKPASPGQRWLVNLPFSIYLGWITVATVANVTDVLYWLGWTGAPLAPQTWAIVMLAVASVVGALMLLTRRDVAYAAVLVWAFAGIGVKFASEPQYATFAWVAAAIVALLAAASAAKKLPKLPAQAAN